MSAKISVNLFETDDLFYLLLEFYIKDFRTHVASSEN